MNNEWLLVAVGAVQAMVIAWLGYLQVIKKAESDKDRAEIDGEAAVLKAQGELLTSVSSVAKDLVEPMRQRLQQHQAESDEMRQQIRDQQRQIEELMRKMEKLESENRQLREELKKAKAREERLAKQVKAVRTSIETGTLPKLDDE